MSLPLINLIGAGRLGKTIGKLFAEAKLGIIQDVCNRSIKSGQEAVAFMGQGKACAEPEALRPADLYFICTPDDLIEVTCQKVMHTCPPPPGSTMIHFSGVLSSTALQAASTHGCSVASLHPMKSFANPAESIHSFRGTYCAFEGDPIVFSLLHPMLTQLGAHVFTIEAHQKALYHAAGVISSNYLVTLAQVAMHCYHTAGISESIAKALVNTLMQDTLNNMNKVSALSDALTGPLARGDSKTLHTHLFALSQHTAYEPLYKMLGKATLALTKHDEAKKQALLAMLEGA